MKALIILLNKILYQIGKLFHKGSSMPGKVALKIDKNILKKIRTLKIINYLNKNYN